MESFASLISSSCSLTTGLAGSINNDATSSFCRSSQTTKLVWRSIITQNLNNAIRKSCEDCVINSLWKESSHLSEAGYPLHVEVSFAEGLTKKYRHADQGRRSNTDVARKRIAGVPHLHKISQNIKKGWRHGLMCR